MRFKPKLWYPIAAVLTVLNVASIPFAAGEPWHALAHGALAVAFGLWAQRLKQRRDQGGDPQSFETPAAGSDRSEEHTSELQSLRHLVCRLLLEKKNK